MPLCDGDNLSHSTTFDFKYVESQPVCLVLQVRLLLLSPGAVDAKQILSRLVVSRSVCLESCCVESEASSVGPLSWTWFVSLTWKMSEQDFRNYRRDKERVFKGWVKEIVIHYRHILTTLKTGSSIAMQITM